METSVPAATCGLSGPMTFTRRLSWSQRAYHPGYVDRNVSRQGASVLTHLTRLVLATCLIRASFLPRQPSGRHSIVVM